MHTHPSNETSASRACAKPGIGVVVSHVMQLYMVMVNVEEIICKEDRAINYKDLSYLSEASNNTVETISH